MDISKRQRTIAKDSHGNVIVEDGGFRAGMIAHSKNQVGTQLCSMVVRFPRFILAELNTHRQFSRNSASSRAIPFKRLCESVRSDPFVPIAFQKDHTGMQGDEYLTGDALERARSVWVKSSVSAISSATTLHKAKVTKQLCNRLLEPFLWHTVIVTSSEWANFFSLRCHPAAEIHMQALAYCMRDCYEASEPKELKMGEWHVPFSANIDRERVFDMIEAYDDIANAVGAYTSDIEDTIHKIAMARCARVSYMNYEGKDDYAADLKLFDRLLSSGHMSPFEHVAQASSANYLSGNFGKGWKQYRKTLDNECRQSYK